MPRALWKGAITFGLVHIPVGLYPAASHDELDFDWLDRRDMAPVGYKRVNKETGKEVPRENIVRGLKHQDGRYVVLSDEEIRSANVKSTQTVDIVAFVDAGRIDVTFFDTPYFLAPLARGEKVYALLREALKREQKVGIAYVVIQTKQHLAALIPGDRALMLNTLRWATDVRSAKELDLPEGGLKASGIREHELNMASELVKKMSERWEPAQYRDSFRDDILKLVGRKVAKGQLKVVATPDDEGEAKQPTAKIIDLTELLKQSLGNRTNARTKKPASFARQKKSRAAVTARRKRA
ncbi:MAG TPA: Ku protein [Burkholderiales bacterium]|nr:Ku protein [Burkholderiales bacterium]